MTIAAAIASGTGYFTTLAKITARPEFGSTEIRACLYDQPITFEGFVYDPAPFTPTQMQNKGNVEADNGAILHLLDTVITRANLVGGKWGGARLEIIQIDYRNPGWGAVKRHIGRVGEATLKGFESDTQFRGLMDLLNQPVGERTSVPCRYKLGETRCGVNVATYTRTGSVTAITNRQRFTVSFTSGTPATAVDGYYKNGKITFTSGTNNGLSMETLDNIGNVIILFQPMLANVAVGNNFNIVAGDDKMLATCHTKFNNAVNYGGEADMPTRETIFKIPE